MTKKVMLIILFMFIILPESALSRDREYLRKCRTPFYKFNAYTKPRTESQVTSAYRWLVNKEDGITKKEALIIAQYEILEKNLEDDYDIRKPKVIKEDDQQWVIRLPGFYSIMQHRIPEPYVVCIDQSNGELRCSKQMEEIEK